MDISGFVSRAFTPKPSPKRRAVDLDNSAAQVSTRELERQRLEDLNHALSRYISRVRALETQVVTLETHIESFASVKAPKNDEVLETLRAQLEQAKAELDDASQRYADLQLEHSNLQEDFKRAEGDIQGLTSLKERLQGRIESLQAMVNRLEGQLASAQSSLQEEKEDGDLARQQLKDLKADLVKHRGRADSEAKARVALENEISGLQESFRLKELEHQSETDALQQQLQVALSQVVVSVKTTGNQYEEEMSRLLRVAKSSYAEAADAFREKLKKYYQMNPTPSAAPSMMQDPELKRLQAENEALRNRVAARDQDVADLKNEARHAEDKIDRLTHDLASTKAENKAHLANKDMEIKNLQQRISGLEDQYRVLLDRNLSLDAEIDQYRGLLGEEYKRLNMHDQSLDAMDQLVGSPLSAQRDEQAGEQDLDMSVELRHMTEEVEEAWTQRMSSNGQIQIQSVDLDRGFDLHLQNIGQEPINFDDCVLTVDNGRVSETLVMPHGHVVAVGQVVRVVSGLGEQSHRPGDIAWTSFRDFEFDNTINVQLERGSQVICRAEYTCEDSTGATRCCMM